MKRLDWTSFSIIRMPYELIPEGFMDDQQVLDQELQCTMVFIKWNTVLALLQTVISSEEVNYL